MDTVLWIRVETKMHCSIFATMQNSCKNETIFAKFCLVKILVFVKNLAKISQKFSENFRTNDKYIKFDTDTYMWCNFFVITSHFRRINRHM
jgi:hypothetical protein